MTYPRHWRATIEGEFRTSLGAVAETWTTSVKIGLSDSSPAVRLNEEDFLNNELTDFCNRLFATQTLFSNQTVVTKLTCNEIGPTGHYADPTHSHTKILGGSLDEIKGLSDSVLYPPQIAIVASLRTANLRGPASKGRMYLPAPTIGLPRDYVLADSSVGALLNNLADAFEHLDGTMTVGGGSVQFYPVVVSSKGSGSLARITSVGLGKVLDTHRSRRTSLSEAPVFRVLT